MLPPDFRTIEIFSALAVEMKASIKRSVFTVQERLVVCCRIG
jgi:hypothetical protein